MGKAIYIYFSWDSFRVRFPYIYKPCVTRQQSLSLIVYFLRPRKTVVVEFKICPEKTVVERIHHLWSPPPSNSTARKLLGAITVLEKKKKWPPLSEPPVWKNLPPSISPHLIHLLPPLPRGLLSSSPNPSRSLLALSPLPNPSRSPCCPL